MVGAFRLLTGGECNHIDKFLCFNLCSLIRTISQLLCLHLLQVFKTYLAIPSVFWIVLREFEVILLPWEYFLLVLAPRRCWLHRWMKAVWHETRTKQQKVWSIVEHMGVGRQAINLAVWLGGVAV